jgi:hypothetical protein
MVFSFRETVLGIEKPVVAGELLSAGNGSHRTGAGAGRPLATGPWTRPNRRINLGRPGLKHTPSLRIFVKSP